MKTIDNPRGYAYISLLRAHTRLCGWSWFAAMRSIGMTPDKPEYVADGLAMYDAMTASMSDLEVAKSTHGIVSQIIKETTRSHREMAKGIVGWHHGRAHVKHDFMDVDDFATQAKQSYSEPGYGRIESADELVRRVGRLMPLLLPYEQRLVSALMELGDIGPHAEVAERLGVDASYIGTALSTIRKKAAAFGEQGLL